MDAELEQVQDAGKRFSTLLERATVEMIYETVQIWFATKSLKLRHIIMAQGVR